MIFGVPVPLGFAAVQGEVDKIIAKRRRGELITRAECELVMTQFQRDGAPELFNPTHPIDPEYLNAPGVMHWPPEQFKDEP